MGILVVVVIIVAVIVFFAKSANKSDHKSTSYSNTSASYAAPVSYSKPVDTIDKQHLYSCIARFVGAISTIRDQCSWRSWTQGGCIQVTRKEDGSYHIHGSYDHDSNYNIQNTLQGGGYLDYFGMKYVEDGFSYQVDGIDPNRDGVITTVDNRMLITDNYIVSTLKERFGARINIKTAWTKDNTTFVSFNFPE